MLRITESQLEAFQKQKGETFNARIVAFLREQFAEYRSVPDADMKSAVAAFTQRAAVYGLDSEIQAVSFVLTTHYLGSDFDTRNRSCNEVLSDAGKTSDWKASWLEAMCLMIEGKRERGEL